jgi:prepilin-type N-terminal cleavage/methylation domain-containing protein/prepilin-type processing-associated H-X9-DG protein
MTSRPFHSERPLRGFTLIELLVVVAIISLLISILLPSLTKARDLARTAICLGNLRSIGGALHMYASENDGYITQDYNPAWNGWIPGDWPEKLGRYLDLGPDPWDGFYGMERLMCPVAQAKISEHPSHPPLCQYHAGYAFNALLDGYRWNSCSPSPTEKPAPKLEDLNPQLVYLADGVLHFGTWNCVHQLVALDFAQDWAHYPDYRHNGGKDRYGPDYEPGDTANFLFLDGHGESVPYDQRYDVVLYDQPLH